MREVLRTRWRGLQPNLTHLAYPAAPIVSRTVLVTGAASGLGLALAQQYARTGWRVVSVIRPGPVAEGIIGIAIQADLQAPDALETIARALHEARVDSLDRLIHNAAVGWVGAIPDMPFARLEALLETNVAVPLRLTHVLLPLLGRAQGKVVFIGSVTAFLPSPAYAVYAASKAAIDGFARALSVELDGRVAVQVVHPGPIRTGFHASSGALDLDSSGFPTAEVIAVRTIRCIERAQWRVFPRVQERLLACCGDWLRPVVDRLVRPASARIDAPSARASATGAPRHAVVTGSASGLGAALARALHERGYRVTGIDLAAAEGGTVETTLSADLSDPHAREGILDTLAAGPPIGLVVHSAGTSATGPFENQSPAAIGRVLGINLHAPLHLTIGLLARNALAPEATMVMVSSLSHFVGYPGAAIYAASKDGLASFGRSLGVAGRGQGYRCLTVLPGPLRTPHATRFSPHGSSDRDRLDPDEAARIIVAAIERKRTLIVIGKGARIAMVIGRIAPTWTTRTFGRIMLRRLRDAPPAG